MCTCSAVLGHTRLCLAVWTEAQGSDFSSCKELWLHMELYMMRNDLHVIRR